MPDRPQPSMRIIDLQWRDLPDGHESEAVFEVAGSDGSKTIVREFWRYVDLGGSYVTVRHAIRGTAPVQTFFVVGQKGELDGDFRTDRTEMLTLHPDGTVRRTEQTVKTWLKADATRQEIAAWYRDGKEAGLTAQQILDLIRSLESPGV